MTLFFSHLASHCLTLHFNILLGPISQEPDSPRNTAVSSIKHRHLPQPCFLSTRPAAPRARCSCSTEHWGGSRVRQCPLLPDD